MKKHIIMTAERISSSIAYKGTPHNSEEALQILQDLENRPKVSFCTLTKSRAIKAMQNGEKVKRVIVFGKEMTPPSGVSLSSLIGMQVKF